MYSPKIAEDLIPLLYRLAKAKGIAMTKLVDQMLRSGLRGDGDEQVTTNSQRSLD